MLAGDKDWWTEVETSFRTHSDEVAQLGSGNLLQGEVLDDDNSFSPDFVVEFLEPSDRSDSLGRLGEYEILEVIGRGGMGVVLKGLQTELGRFVAVKVMAPALATSGAARQRFVREARAAAAIVHPNVMPIHSVCTTSRLPYLVMPFLACESLQQRIDRQGSLDVTEILRIGLQVARGLAASHAQGLVHRDVKPANILLEKGVDRVMLTDFGLARAADDSSLTRTGTVTGTPQYMSPEQSFGEALDCRSDLFSLGSVLYTMCTGRSPFRAETALAVLRRISDTQARPIREINPNIPQWLELIVARLHAKAADNRFQSANELLELLEQCLAHLQQPGTKPLPQMPKIISTGATLVKQSPWKPNTARFLVLVGCCVLMVAIWLVVTAATNRPGHTARVALDQVQQRETSITTETVAGAVPPIEPLHDVDSNRSLLTGNVVGQSANTTNSAREPRPFAASDLPFRRSWNFQGRSPNFLSDWGSREQDSVLQLERGLKVTRKHMADTSEIGVAFEMTADVSNDFEITLEFCDFKSTPVSNDWRVPRVDISGQIFSVNDPEKRVHVLGINHRRDVEGRMSVVAVQGDQQPSGSLEYRSASMSVKRDSGRLRLVRQGGDMFYQTSPLETEKWTTTSCFPVDRGPFKSIVVGLRTDDLEGSGEVTLTNVSIRAQGTHER
jgi:serine/threonine protein kinase